MDKPNHLNAGIDSSGFSLSAHDFEGFTGELLFNEPLVKHTYYRIGGPALALVFPRSKEDIRVLGRLISERNIPYFILGQGSNILVSDEGFPGIVIRCSRLNLELTEIGQPVNQDIPSPGFVLRTGASVAVSSLLRKASQEGWSGLEFLTGIPGSIGGVASMNAGTHLGEAKDKIIRVETLSLGNDHSELEVFEGSKLQFQYRKNLFLSPNSVVWSVDWKLEKAPADAVKQIIDSTLKRRKDTQPVDYPSCGSVFKNPKSTSLKAWQLIEKLGLRGHQIGNARFSEKHPNFIVNLKGAKAADVYSLIQLAKAKAAAELNIQLEEEVIYIGKMIETRDES